MYTKLLRNNKEKISNQTWFKYTFLNNLSLGLVDHIDVGPADMKD